MNSHFYLDGTGNGGKRVTGLAALIPEDPTTGTLFGINRANETWWRSNLQDDGAASSAVDGVDTSGTHIGLTMRKGMTRLYQLCGQGGAGGTSNRNPDLILCSEGYYNAYDDALAQSGQGQRFINQEAADAGYETLKFKGATMIADEDCPSDATNTSGSTGGTGIFINSQFMKLCYAPKRNFSTKGMDSPVDQDAFVDYIQWAGELVVTNSNKHGRHIGIKEVV